MKLFIKLLFLILIVSIQACQVARQQPEVLPADLAIDQTLILPPSAEADSTEAAANLQRLNEQNQLVEFFSQSNEYHNFTIKKQQQLCRQLKQDYKENSDWKTAWLLVYALNDDFKCLTLSKSLGLLKAMQKDTEMNSQFYWLNAQQIKLFNDLRNAKRKSYSLSNKLKKENSKIEALKAIESDINDKLDGE
ncbi:MAG: hypothetical protein COA90_06625 [Gammaproteobacteria bacterium]|nr:MAG: hypothetical protein COA90_06625 [Gammaproteobacteria bacterium]